MCHRRQLANTGRIRTRRFLCDHLDHWSHSTRWCTKTCSRLSDPAPLRYNRPIDRCLTAALNGCITDTSPLDFEAGVPANVDLLASPGDVLLSSLPSIDQQQLNNSAGIGFSTT